MSTAAPLVQTMIDVRPIGSKRDRDEFIKLQWTVNREYPNWVPPLLMDRRKLMDRAKNPFYKHAEAEFWLARRGGEVVGRIGAIVNHNHNKVHNEKLGFFGFFESINDQSVADALFRTAIGWLKERGMTAVRGPVTPSVNDEYGLLIDGFDKPPVVLMPYNPPYYPVLIESAGFHKVKDLYAFRVHADTVFDEKLVRVSEALKQRQSLTFRSLNMDKFDEEVDLLKGLYNRAWERNWGAVPMTDEEFDALAADLKPIVVPEVVLIAEYKGEPIGFSLSIPDLNIALKHNPRGWLLTGFLQIMLWKKKTHRARIIVLGVLPEYQRTGAGGVLFYETGRKLVEYGYPEGEASWVLEDNVMMIRGAELMSGERYKTYRLYELSIL